MPSLRSRTASWQPDERYRLDVETDALVALPTDSIIRSYAVVLDSFEVMERTQTQAHGHYKFKEDCLAAFDRLVAAAPEEATVGSA